MSNTPGINNIQTECPDSLTQYMYNDLLGFVNRLKPEQNNHHFADDNFKYIFLNENCYT